MRLAGGYLIFLGAAPSVFVAKTGVGVAQWAPERCIGQSRLPGCAVDLGLPDLTPAEAYAAGARTMIFGLAPFGGNIEEDWIPVAVAALSAGLDIASGMHTRLADIPELAETATRLGRTLHDVRHPGTHFPVASGRKRSGMRLLTVGTDCAVGKKYAALAIHRAFQQRGRPSTFRATGQTGIMIAGSGIPIDSVVADFVAGAAETLSPDNAMDHWDIIEGQGSLFHPAYAGVSLGLLHGSQPDVFVVVHDPQRHHIDGYPTYPVSTIEACIAQTLAAGRLTNPAMRCGGIAINGGALNDAALARECAVLQDRHGVPCFDALRTDIGPLVDLL